MSGKFLKNGQGNVREIMEIFWESGKSGKKIKMSGKCQGILEIFFHQMSGKFGEILKNKIKKNQR